jgi:chitodextrinase
MRASRRPPRAAPGLISAVLLVTTLAFLAPAASAARKGAGSSPTTPTDLRVTGTTASTVSLAWNPSTDNGGVTRLRYIVVDSRGFGTLVWHPQTTVTITSLTPGSTYSFHVYAEDQDWNRSGNSNTVTATLPHDTTPPSPPVLSVDGVTPSQVSLSWTASTDDIPLNIAGYRLLADGAPATNVLWITNVHAVVRHLAPASTHSFTVEARDRSGNVATSNTVSATTEASSDTEAPTIPTNLRWIEDRGDCEVVVAWDQSTDNVDGQSAIEYEVYVNGAFSDLAIGSGAIHTYGARGAATSTFTLRAVDRTGNTSAASSALTLTIDGC